MAEIETIDPVGDRIKCEIFEAATRQPRRTSRSVSMSTIGHPCERQAWYRFRNFDSLPMDGRVLLLFTVGDVIEDLAVKWLSNRYTIAHAGTDQMMFEDHGGLFRGYADGIIHGVMGGDERWILEIKSAGASSFRKFKANGVEASKIEYYVQLQCYMGYASLQCYMGYASLDKALFVMVNKDNSDLYCECVQFQPGVFYEAKQKAARVIRSQSPPDRTGVKKSDPICKFCDYKSWCWDKNMMVQYTKTCGSCKYLLVNNLTMWCDHPDHPFLIDKWGQGCDDWEEMDHA